MEYFDGSAWVNLGDVGLKQDPPQDNRISTSPLDPAGTLYIAYSYFFYRCHPCGLVRWASRCLGQRCIGGFWFKEPNIDSQGTIYVETTNFYQPIRQVVDGAFSDPMFCYPGGEEYFFTPLRWVQRIGYGLCLHRIIRIFSQEAYFFFPFRNVQVCDSQWTIIERF